VTRIAKGIKYAQEHGADIINLSLSYEGTLSGYVINAGYVFMEGSLRGALDEGIQIIIASGNCGQDYQGVNALGRVDARAMVVGGTNLRGTDIFMNVRSSMCPSGYMQSQGGPELDLVAPAESIIAARLGGGDPVAMTGTSMAAPIVAGLAALYLSGGTQRNDLSSVLSQNVIDLGPAGRDDRTGRGRVVAGIEIVDVVPSSVAADQTTRVLLGERTRNFDRGSKVIVDGTEQNPTSVVDSLGELEFDVTPPSGATSVEVKVRHPSGSLESNAVHLTVTRTSQSFAYVSAGGMHTCALTIAGEAYCWGFNESGELGDSTNTDRYTPVAVRTAVRFVQTIAGGYSSGIPGGHTCGLTSGGTAYCWGKNDAGQLGDGTRHNRNAAVPVQQGPRVFVQLSAGALHTCGLTNAGQAYCWGWNDYGQLGDSTTTERLEPVPVQQGTVGFSQLAAGDSHTCGLTDTGAAYCWGYNFYGGLGDGTRTDRLTPVPVQQGSLVFRILDAGGVHTCALTDAGKAYCWGFNGYGAVGNGDTTGIEQTSPVPVLFTGTFAEVDAGYSHTCGLSNVGTRTDYCWGFNQYGQVGDNTTTNRYAPVLVQSPPVLERFSAGSGHTCALTIAGEAYCWGWNGAGQLGDGTTTDRWTPAPVNQSGQSAAVSFDRDNRGGTTGRVTTTTHRRP
jgi:alpha-tubulin suppressor-like RCC1 family protein